MGDTIIQGSVWVLTDGRGALIEDIDTDQIFHNAHLHITDISQMGQYALGNLEGWKDFPKQCRPGNIVVAGRNFGAGSSRQQAVDCFIALKSGAILAPSFAAIYFRNAVNSGFPVLRGPDLGSLVSRGQLKTGDVVRLDLVAGTADNISRGSSFGLEPMSRVQYDIFLAGNLFRFGKKLASA